MPQADPVLKEDTIPNMKTFSPPVGWKESKGIFVSPHPVTADPEYPEYLRDWLASIETKHFWFRSRARLIACAVRSWVSAGGWLELGCGTGYVVAEVGRRYSGPCFGQEVSWRALEIARGRTRAALYLCAADEVPVGDLDGVGLLDVIEHLDDDVSALKVASGYVKKDGAVLITVPAHPWLWSQVDEISGHQRRYGRDALLRAMESAGLRVEVCRPFFGSLLPGVLLRRTIRADDTNTMLQMCLRPPPEPVNALLYAVTEFERWSCRKGLTLFGTSWLALGRKT